MRNDAGARLILLLALAGCTAGATGIKIYSNLDQRLVAGIAAEAHAQGMRVWSHPVIFPTRPSEVIAAGVDVVSHANLLVWESAESLPATRPCPRSPARSHRKRLPGPWRRSRPRPFADIVHVLKGGKPRQHRRAARLD